MHLDPWTLGLQTANFLVLLWLLRRFLYRPVLAVIAARQAAADQRVADLAARDAALKARLAEVERREAAIVTDRDSLLAAARQAAADERQSLLTKAQADADAVRSEAQTAFERERAEAAASLGRDAARLAATMARRLCEEVADGPAQERMIDLMGQDIRALSPETARRIAERLTGGGVHVSVVSAAPIDEAGTRRLADLLGRTLGTPCAPIFRVDPALIAGVEVHFPFTILRRTWADSLRRIEDGLSDADHA